MTMPDQEACQVVARTDTPLEGIKQAHMGI